jgi:hypothetical protein
MNSSASSAVSASEPPSTAPYWRWGGYALLVLAVIDLAESLIPPSFMNPTWELQLMGITIERSPVLLLGFLMVFHAEWTRRARWELPLLPVISWAALAVGIVFLLMIPLLFMNMFRMDAGGGAQITAQVDQQMTQAKHLQETVSTAQGEALENLLRRLGRDVNPASAETVRQQVLTEMAQAQTDLQRRAEELRSTQKLNLHKRTYKHAAQSLIIGGVMVGLWSATGWARRGRRSN